MEVIDYSALFVIFARYEIERAESYRT